jgi:hypothetical protein
MIKEQQREEDWLNQIRACPHLNTPQNKQLYFSAWWDGFYRAEHQTDADKKDSAIREGIPFSSIND